MSGDAAISSRIVIAMRDYAARQIGSDVAGEVFEAACTGSGVDIDDARDPRGWVPIEMFHLLAEGFAPIIRGDFIADAVSWIIPARRELSSMSLTALARPSLFYRQLDRARGFYAKHVRFEVEVTSASAATVELHHDDGLERRPESCAVARGVLTAIPLLFHLPAAEVEETACYADGADHCKYQVRWNRTKHHAMFGFIGGLALAPMAVWLTESWAWLALPAVGWLLGLGLVAASRRRHMMTVIEEQRVALGNAEADLERRFREVFDLKETLQNLEKTQSEILDAGVQALLGELVGEFAHEMSNPMSSVLFNLSYLEGATAPAGEPKPTSSDIAEVEAVLGDIRYGVERMRGVLAWFVDVFRSGGQEPDLIALDEEVERGAKLLRREWADRVEIHVELGDTPRVRSFGKEIVQVLINLLVNAAHATERGNIWVRTAVVGDRVVLTIRDDGSGMSEAVLGRAFDRGFSTKQSGANRGRGLGLFICKSITERNDGTIALASEEGVGTTATVSFPIAAAPDPKQAAPSAPAQPAPH